MGTTTTYEPIYLPLLGLGIFIIATVPEAILRPLAIGIIVMLIGSRLWSRFRRTDLCITRRGRVRRFLS